MALFHFMWVSHVYYLIATYGFNTLKFKSPVSKKNNNSEVAKDLEFPRFCLNRLSKGIATLYQF